MLGRAEVGRDSEVSVEGSMLGRCRTRFDAGGLSGVAEAKGGQRRSTMVWTCPDVGGWRVFMLSDAVL